MRGTKISSNAVARAMELYDLDIIHATLEDVGLEACSFDVITLWHVFEHWTFPAFVDTIDATMESKN